MRALTGSIALHAALVAVLVLVFRGGDADEPRPPAVVELVEVTTVEPVPPRVLPGGGGGTPGRAAPERAAPERDRRAPAPRRELVAPRRTRPSSMPATRDLASALSSLAEPGLERPGGDGGDGGGTGGGHGSGRGGGVGAGTGDALAAIASQPAPPAPPPAPRASKARPAKLIYPARERDVGDGTLFVARVIVDHEGFVVGAHLVRGAGGPRDAEAGRQIFRFRYSPALDDEGTPIRSTLEQPFLVQ